MRILKENKEKTNWEEIDRILKKSWAGEIAPPREKGFWITTYHCPLCNAKAKKRYFKEREWGGTMIYRFLECRCGWQHAAPALL